MRATERGRTLGEIIRTTREAKGLTLRGLAKAAGVSAPFLSDVEHGRRSLGDSLPKIAKVLGINEARLLLARLHMDADTFRRQHPEIAALLSGTKCCPCCQRYGAQP